MHVQKRVHLQYIDFFTTKKMHCKIVHCYVNPAASHADPFLWLAGLLVPSLLSQSQVWQAAAVSPSRVHTYTHTSQPPINPSCPSPERWEAKRACKSVNMQRKSSCLSNALWRAHRDRSHKKKCNMQKKKLVNVRRIEKQPGATKEENLIDVLQ